MRRVFVNITCALMLFVGCYASAKNDRQKHLFEAVQFKQTDAVLVTQHSPNNRQILYSWQADKLLIPASLTKLVTTQLALDKWGAEHRFKSDFFIHQSDGINTLWVKGYGDPFLTSEEFDQVASNIRPLLPKIDQISIDNNWFAIEQVPGRTAVVDPYNAPLSAVSANFNTVFVERKNGHLSSAEIQTPLTQTAINVASNLKFTKERVNLVNADNAQMHFAQILISKLNLSNLKVIINATVPEDAKRLYTHINSNTLADNLRASLKYSNNFIANQLFLKLSEIDSRTASASLGVLDSGPTRVTQALTFSDSQSIVDTTLREHFNWSDFEMLDGAGLSRANRFSARQIDQVMWSLAPRKSLLKRIEVKDKGVEVFAKTGTLNGVRSYAGFIQISKNDIIENYTFVFIFNRDVPFAYRDSMLERLVKDLQQ